MTLTIPGWVFWVVAGLVVCGLVAVYTWVMAAAVKVGDWWRNRGPLPLEDDERDAEQSGVPVSGFRRLRAWKRTHGDEDDEPDWISQWTEEASLEELPLAPERTWEQMTHHQLPIDVIDMDRGVHLSAPLERRPPWWQTEILNAYAAVGLEGTGFTRAMASQVREMAP